MIYHQTCGQKHRKLHQSLWDTNDGVVTECENVVLRGRLSECWWTGHKTQKKMDLQIQLMKIEEILPCGYD